MQKKSVQLFGSTNTQSGSGFPSASLPLRAQQQEGPAPSATGATAAPASPKSVPETLTPEPPWRTAAAVDSWLRGSSDVRTKAEPAASSDGRMDNPTSKRRRRQQSDEAGDEKHDKCFYCGIENPDHPGRLCPEKPCNKKQRLRRQPDVAAGGQRGRSHSRSTIWQAD